MHKALHADNTAAMEKIGRQLAVCAYKGMHIYLRGDLGAGKTTLVRGFLREFNFQGKVKSPTYTLVEPYQLKQTRLGDLDVYHFDLYRIHDPLELEAMGWRDYLDSDAICLLEWPEKAGSLLTQPDIAISIDIDADSRFLSMEAASRRSMDLLARLSI